MLVTIFLDTLYLINLSLVEWVLINQRIGHMYELSPCLPFTTVLSLLIWSWIWKF